MMIIDMTGFVAGVFQNKNDRGPRVNVTLFEKISGGQPDSNGYEPSIPVRAALWDVELPESIDKGSFVRIVGTGRFVEYNGETRLELNLNTAEGGLIEETERPQKNGSGKKDFNAPRGVKTVRRTHEQRKLAAAPRPVASFIDDDAGL